MKSLKSVVSFGNIRMAFAFLIIGMGISGIDAVKNNYRKPHEAKISSANIKIITN